MNRTLITNLAVALLLSVSLGAQTPLRFGAAVTVGANGYAGVAALDGGLASYQMQASSVNWTDKTPAFGAEATMLVADRWKVDLGAMFQFSFNPGYQEVPGTAVNAAAFEPGDIPSYRSVAADQKFSFLVYAAGSYYFSIPKIPALRPYAGLRLTYAYANDQQKYDELESMGISAAENFSLSAACIGGIDYFITPHFFIGASVDLVRYTYGVTQYRPQDGLAPLAGDTHYLGALGAPQIKIGFLF